MESSSAIGCCHCVYSEADNKTIPPRVVELFAGIGGWHNAIRISKIFDGCCSLKGNACSKDALDVFAVDISDPACNIYRHNFPNVNIYCKSIESFDSSIFEGKGSAAAISPTAILAMSPPCQPFTRIGLKRDLDDRRTSGLKHVCDLLKKCDHAFRPRMIVVENVAGFETSSARDLLLETLITCGYDFREFLLSPYNFGIPNARLRYYLAGALANPLAKGLPVSSNSPPSIPPFSNAWKEEDNFSFGAVHVPISTFLESRDKAMDESFLNAKHKRYLKVLDIVRPNSERSMCFTSSYARYMEGTGSVLNISLNDDEEKDCGNNNNNNNNNNVKSCEDHAANSGITNRESIFEAGQLRFFSPREVANLLSFPADFSWPSNSTSRQLYKCLGNSINCRVASYIVEVVAEMLKTNFYRYKKQVETETNNSS